MLIESKKDKRREVITPEEWETLKEVGFSTGWNVINKNEQPKMLPKELVEFKNRKK